jgi:hypothetical protein
MKNINKMFFGRDTKYLLILLSLFLSLYACKEQARYEIGYDDSVPPSAPVYEGKYTPLHGGARLFYKIPPDEDLLSIDASYLNKSGKKVWFSVSYFKDSIDVLGLSDSLDHDIQLYAVDRAGNKSDIVTVTVKPLKPAYLQVAEAMIVKPGFSSFYLDWVNLLGQSMNIYADFSYTKQGRQFEHHMIYTSYLPTDNRWFIRDLEDVTEPISVKVRVEDTYGNVTDPIDKGQIVLLHDELIPKDKWIIPEPNDSVGGVPMAFLQMGEARKEMVKDGIIDDGTNVNYVHTGANGRTGLPKDGLAPWNILIDLGDEYEISRIITHQRYYTGTYPTTGRGTYYGYENVGIYNMYILNENGEWDYVNQHKITFPNSATPMDLMHLGRAGDMAYLYPDDPQFSKPTRWFRYEAMFTFDWNYTDQANLHCLSEITLYGRKKTGN